MQPSINLMRKYFVTLCLNLIIKFAWHLIKNNTGDAGLGRGAEKLSTNCVNKFNPKFKVEWDAGQYKRPFTYVICIKGDTYIWLHDNAVID